MPQNIFCGAFTKHAQSTIHQFYGFRKISFDRNLRKMLYVFIQISLIVSFIPIRFQYQDFVLKRFFFLQRNCINRNFFPCRKTSLVIENLNANVYLKMTFLQICVGNNVWKMLSEFHQRFSVLVLFCSVLDIFSFAMSLLDLWFE